MIHRYRCSECKWDGPQSDVREHKGPRHFPVCPGCGKSRASKITEFKSYYCPARRRVIRGQKMRNHSCLSGYAVREEQA